MKRIILITATVLVAALFAVGQSLGAGDYGSYGMTKDEGAMSMEKEQMESAVSLNSEQIIEVQTILADRGFSPGPADGVIGEETRTALREFQAEEGLAVTGETDIKTLRALAPDTETQELLGIAPKFDEREPGLGVPLVEPEEMEREREFEYLVP